MKKLTLTIAIVLGLGLTTFANPNGGGLFQRGAGDEEYSNGLRTTGAPMLPTHGQSENQDSNETPLSGGIAVLTVLGGAYLVGKKRKDE